MKKLLLIICCLLANAAMAQTPDANGILYVDISKTGGTGSSWGSATKQLADALVAAKNNPAITQIWVAGGTYKPLYSPADNNFGNADGRNNAFLLVNNVKIYGGFAGTEVLLTDRNLTLTANKSTLSGDVIGDDGANFANNVENTYHVVLSIGFIGTAELNGFTISGGNANGSSGMTVNTSTINQYSGGGMINASSSLVLTNVAISGNVATNGGGMYGNFSSPVLTNVAISGNVATSGGGMYGNFSSPVLTNVTISGNMASNTGGGVHNSSSSPIMTNVTISGNRALANGGGMHNNASSPVLTNVTIGGNRAEYGGGIYNNFSSSPKINNSIIDNNNIGVTNSASTPVYKNSLVQGNPTGVAMVSYTGSSTIVFVNPQAPGLSTLGDYTLKAGSPAINKGSNTFFATGQTPDLSGITTDLAGNPRKQGGTIDLGAYEFNLQITPDANGILYVKKYSTGNGSSWAYALGELADALVAAKSNPAITQIWVASGTYKPMYSPADNNFGNADGRNNTFLLVNNVKIYGGFAGTETSLALRDLTLSTNKSTLSGDVTGDDGANFANDVENTYHVVTSAGVIGTAELNGFTISGGNANGSSSLVVNTRTIFQYSGGGIFNTSSPVLTNVTISGNSATNGGGGMCNTSSSPVLTNVTISGNKADYGGGIHNSTASSPALTKATISGNSATNGGGMYNDFSSSPVLTNVTISGNTADYGGGVYNQNSSSPVLTNATISGNKASVNGGGMINNASSSPKINNSIIYNNNTGVFNYDTNSVPVYKNSLVQDNPTGTAMVSYTGAANGTGIFVNPLAPGLNTLGDYTLLAGSAAINMGSNTFFATGQTPDLSGIISDLAGNPRIQKTTIDMGAYESPYNPKTIPNATGIVYVKQNGAGNFTGNSWVNAAPELADALIAAKNNTTITQIWVAGGTYKPLYSPADNNFGNADGRNNAFLLVNNVKIYGGFAGTEVLLTDRDLTITINKSTLSGDLDNSNTINTNDAYHVAIAADAVGTAELNGFAISGGRADGSSSIIINTSTINQNYGSGMYNSSSSPLLTNLTISGNVGGMYNNSSSPTLINVTISGNTATNGGGMHNSSSSPVLINVSISGNVASANGGGMINSLSSPVLTNVTISGNSASVGGGMYNNLSSSPKINNSIIYNNNTGVTNSASTPVYKNSLVQGNPTGAAMVNYTGAANIIFVNPQAPGFSTLGDYSLLAGSAAINAGSNQLYIAAGGDLATGKDLVGNPRVIEMTIDMGAYENQTIPVLPVNFGKFSAMPQSNHVKLYWNTFSETNNEAFIIYRSTDGLNYTEIITQNTKGTNANSYTVFDNNPANGTNYYRLSQKDNDGTITKLADAVVNFSLANAEVNAWPNPVEKTLHVSFSAGKYQSLKLVDITGKTLQKLNISITQSEIEIGMATYPKGIYIVELKGKNGSHLVKVIK